jgi:hypothetical protein
MRAIRPQTLVGSVRRRAYLFAVMMLGAGLLALELAVAGATSPTGTGLLACAAAVGLGVGVAWLVRASRPDRARRASDALVTLLGATFDDDYTLVVAPRLGVRDQARLSGILVGPAGVRVLTVRDWEGRYRVRGRVWEFDAHGRRGWISCRTNPSFDAVALTEGVVRWARGAGLPDAPVRPAVVFPYARSRIVLEEPADEVVTTDNAPWWANTIGRVRRLDPATSARIVDAVLDAAEPARAALGPAPVPHGPA